MQECYVVWLPGFCHHLNPTNAVQWASQASGWLQVQTRPPVKQPGLASRVMQLHPVRHFPSQIRHHLTQILGLPQKSTSKDNSHLHHHCQLSEVMAEPCLEKRKQLEGKISAAGLHNRVSLCKHTNIQTNAQTNRLVYRVAAN